MQEVMGLLITTLLQIYQEIFQWKKIVKRLRFDKIVTVILWPYFLAHPVVQLAYGHRPKLRRAICVNSLLF